MATKYFYYQELIEKDLAEIKAEYESGVGLLTKPEYMALTASYRGMLDSKNEVFFGYVKKLTKLEHEMVVKRMSKALLRQYNKPDANQTLTLAVQMKQDFSNIKQDFLNASNQIIQELKFYND